MKLYTLLIACLLSFSGIKAQTFTRGHISVTLVDTMYHDSTKCACTAQHVFNVTIDSSYLGETFYAVDSTMGGVPVAFDTNRSGASPWIFSSNTWTRTNTDYRQLGGVPGYLHFSVDGIKAVCGLDTLRYISYKDSLFVTNPCEYDSVESNVYIDNNSNCIYDAGDVGINPSKIIISELLSSPVGTIVDEYAPFMAPGWVLHMVQKSWMVNYSVSLPSYYAFIFPMSPCFSGPYSFTTLPQHHVDFPMQCSSNVDVQSDALAPSAVRLHSDFFLHPYVSNLGCSAASGQMTLVKDSRVIYDPMLSMHPADIVTGDTLIWNYSGISSIAGGPYWNTFLSSIFLTPDATVAAGDTLCFRVYSNIPTTDINTANNDNTICIPVVYSFDPNVKEVIPAGTGTQGYIPAGTDTLTYTLHFQNTGSAAAFDINVIDTLDSHINPNSLRILGASHQMSPQWLAPNVVKFNFANIHLPDSGSNEPGSHGQVKFRVALNPGLPYHTQIKNTGYIYFDLNAPVITNTTLNTIAAPTFIKTVNTQPAISVYPSPAADYIMVDGPDEGEICVVRLDGSVVLKQTIMGAKTKVDVSRLPNGVYILKAISNANTAMVKFTKL